MDSLVEEAIPGFAFAVLKGSITVCFLFLEEYSPAIHLTKIAT